MQSDARLNDILSKIDTNAKALNIILDRISGYYGYKNMRLNALQKTVDRVLTKELNTPGLIHITKLLVSLELYYNDSTKEASREQIWDKLAQGSGIELDMYKLIKEEWISSSNYVEAGGHYIIGKENFSIKIALLITEISKAVFDVLSN